MRLAARQIHLERNLAFVFGAPRVGREFNKSNSKTLRGFEIKVKELLGKPKNKKMAELSIFGAFSLFAWLLLIFCGTIDLISFVMTGQWYRLTFLGIIAVCITAICLIFKKGHTRGFSIADFAGISVASLVVGGILALV